MPTYYLSNTDSDLSGGADFNKVLATVTEAASSISAEIAASTTETSYAWTRSDFPNNADWETGSITVEVDVTVANTKLLINVSASRVNSSGAVQETSDNPALGEQECSLGLHTYLIPIKDWAAGNATDRIRINYIIRNSFSHGAQSTTIETGTTDTEVITAITHPVGAVAVANVLQAVWDIKQKITDTSQLIWTDCVPVSDSSQFIWNEKEIVAGSSQSIWNIGKIASNVSEFIWNVDGVAVAVGNTIQHIWDIKQVASTDSQIIWNIKTLVADTVQYIWNVTGLVNNAIQHIWNIKQTSSNTTQFIWNIRIAASNTIQKIWGVKASTANYVQAIWDVVGPLNKTIQQIWNIKKGIAGTSNLQWSTKSLASNVIQKIWNVKQAVVDVSQLVWNTLVSDTTPTSDCDFTILQGSTTIATFWNQVVPTISTTTTQFALTEAELDLISYTDSVATLKIAVTGAIYNGTATTQIRIKTISLRLPYAAVALVATKLVQLVWDTRAAVTDAPQYLWNTKVTIADTSQYTWNIKNTAINTAQIV